MEATVNEHLAGAILSQALWDNRHDVVDALVLHEEGCWQQQVHLAGLYVVGWGREEFLAAALVGDPALLPHGKNIVP
jgi:hypothetical protein